MKRLVTFLLLFLPLMMTAQEIETLTPHKTTADILSWLQHTGNYVRYIADVYGDYYWDVSGKFSE
jgi:hypothetical protein